MLKKSLFRMMTMLVVVMLVFTVIGCNNDDTKSVDDSNNSNDDSNDNDDNSSISVGEITSLSVKTKGIKSLYAGNVAVTGNSVSRAIVNGNGNILTLSQIDENGKNAPVVFTNSSNKQYMLEIVDMEKIDNTHILVGYNGIYEVTVGDDGNITVGAKEDRTLSGALIDMKSGRVYEFEHVYMQDINAVSTFAHQLFFIENNICYYADGWPNQTVYKIDLTSASPQSVPLSNGDFVRIDSARPGFTIDGKVIGRRYDTDGGWKLYSVETNGTGWRPVEKPENITGKDGFLATVPASTLGGTGDDVPLFNNIYEGLIMKDLSGNTWLYSLYRFDDNKCYTGFSGWLDKYMIVQLHLNSAAQFEVSNLSKGNIGFEGERDQYLADNYGGHIDYLPFYINDAGIALSSIEDSRNSGCLKTETFLHNGVYLLNTKGFIKITKKQNGIEQTSAALTIPKVTRKTAVISKDGYLYWVVANTGIKRLKLESGATAEDIYTNSNIIADANANALRDYLIISGGDTLVFYVSSVGSIVYTYSLDLNNPKYSSPKILAENDIQIKAVAELNF